MALLFWDASALAKRYTEEVGSETVDALFAGVPLRAMATTPWGYAETYSILLRRLHSGVLDLPTFNTTTTALHTEVVDSPDFGILPIGDTTIFASTLMMQKHGLNATDAAILTMLLAYLAAPPPSDFALIASDKRLVRAANAEGLKTLNPELLPAVGVPDFLKTL